MRKYVSLLVTCLMLLPWCCAEEHTAQEIAIRESLGPYSEGLFTVYIEGKYGFINANGAFISEPQWDSVWPFSEGLALVMSDNKYSYIDTNGMVVISLEAEKAESFHEGLAAVQIDGRWGFIDKTGSLVIEPRWRSVMEFSEGLAGVASDDWYWGFIDTTGSVVIEPQWKRIKSFKQGRAIVSLDGVDPETWLCKITGFIDKTGALAIEADEQWTGLVESFSDNVALIYKGDGNWIYIDLNGNALIEYTMDGNGRCYSFSEGLARVRIETDYYDGYRVTKDSFIDLSGEIVIDTQGGAWDFHDGLAVICQDGKSGYIDTNGIVVIDLIWDWAADFSDGYAVVWKDGLRYIIDMNGNITF